MKQGGTAGIPSLTKVYFVKDFFIAMNKLLEPCHEERSLEMIRPTLEEAMQYQKDYKVVPVLKEIYSDIRTPMQVLKILKKASKHCYMLESVENQENWGRYTFLGYKPKLCVTCMNGKLKVTDVNGTVIREVLVQHPEACINEILADYKSPKIEGFPTFTGGLVGYFAYDYIKYSEPKLNLDAEDEEGFNVVCKQNRSMFPCSCLCNLVLSPVNYSFSSLLPE